LYIVLTGKIELRTAPPDGGYKPNTIGTLIGGDSLGEEGIYKVGPVLRKDSAYAEEDSYLMELSKEILVKAKETMEVEGLGMDWFTLNNNIKRQYL